MRAVQRAGGSDVSGMAAGGCTVDALEGVEGAVGGVEAGGAPDDNRVGGEVLGLLVAQPGALQEGGPLQGVVLEVLPVPLDVLGHAKCVRVERRVMVPEREPSGA